MQELLTVAPPPPPTPQETSAGKKLHIMTWGCQMNVYDSSKMADLLQPLGYRPSATAEDADLVILNTCHIREKAAEKIFSELGRLRVTQQKRAAQGVAPLLIGVAGCVAQAEGAQIISRAPFVDMVFGPQTYHRLPEMVVQALRRHGSGAMGGGAGGGAVIDTAFPVESKFDFLPQQSQNPGVSAFLSVQEGCDKFCTFCVVPYTRGAEYSRPAAAVLAEARQLISQGVKEITLLGQNVNAYHGEGPNGAIWGLGRLIRELAEMAAGLGGGLARIRYTTSHPQDMDADLIAVHGSVPQLMPFLHLPVQSGSDIILQAMNRKHRAADYRRVIDQLRAARPDIAFSSDFIVGFPNETEADFEQTLQLVEDVGYASAYSFQYSPRPGTPAALMAGQVPDAVAKARLHRLQALLAKQMGDFNQRFIGKTIPVLLDRQGKYPGQALGRSAAMQPVHVAGAAAQMGSIQQVRIERGDTNSLAGVLV